MRVMVIKLRKENIINSFSAKYNSHEKYKLLVKKICPGIEFEMETRKKIMLASMINYFEDKKGHLFLNIFGFTPDVGKIVEENMKNALKKKIVAKYFNE